GKIRVGQLKENTGIQIQSGDDVRIEVNMPERSAMFLVNEKVFPFRVTSLAQNVKLFVQANELNTRIELLDVAQLHSPTPISSTQYLKPMEIAGKRCRAQHAEHRDRGIESGGQHRICKQQGHICVSLIKREAPFKAHGTWKW
ncbi:MAG: hypothetical protein EZS28_049920, partial [Streblomastix strix]